MAKLTETEKVIIEGYREGTMAQRHKILTAAACSYNKKHPERLQELHERAYKDTTSNN